MKLLPDGDRQSEARNILLPVPYLSASSLFKKKNTVILPLQPPQEDFTDGWQHLSMQVKRINQLAYELEAAILELKTIADNLDEQKVAQASKQFPLKKISCKKVCSYIPLTVPYVQQKSDGTLIVKKRKVDLFRSEREAKYLAQKLRHQIKRKNFHFKQAKAKKYINLS
ncbi:hypothetical protein [Mastigocoleus testarum]|uniref:Uncharacterized protein n=1 Tax=Mastigocoleus testarum BC008 TaxID=371196 RepID=A0A0V7ZDV5_9CYAN|nr:hypothetical protein [Mastigocoleus testarum]KST62730.1 hypothetical protein BC008_38555 [Mastigocoleus testarum BC008]